MPQVTCDLPLHPIPLQTEWSHLSDLHLADPGFGFPGKINQCRYFYWYTLSCIHLWFMCYFDFGCTVLLSWPTSARCTRLLSFLWQIEISTDFCGGLNPRIHSKDCRMTRVTFRVASSAFIANMSVKQNTIEFAHKYPLASKVVEELFYLDNCLTGADSEEGIQLQA